MYQKDDPGLMNVIIGVVVDNVITESGDCAEAADRAAGSSADARAQAAQRTQAAADLDVATLLVQPTSAAIMVSVGDAPTLVPSRSSGSSVMTLTSRTLISVRECDTASPTKV